MRGSEPSRVEPSTLWLKATKEVFENFPYNGRSEISVLTFLPPLMDYRCGFVGFICMYALVFLTLKLGTPPAAVQVRFSLSLMVLCSRDSRIDAECCLA